MGETRGERVKLLCYFYRTLSINFEFFLVAKLEDIFCIKPISNTCRAPMKLWARRWLCCARSWIVNRRATGVQSRPGNLHKINSGFKWSNSGPVKTMHRPSKNSCLFTLVYWSFIIQYILFWAHSDSWRHLNMARLNYGQADLHGRTFFATDYSGDPKTGHSNTGLIRKPDILTSGLTIRKPDKNIRFSNGKTKPFENRTF